MKFPRNVKTPFRGKIIGDGVAAADWLSQIGVRSASDAYGSAASDLRGANLKVSRKFDLGLTDGNPHI